MICIVGAGLAGDTAATTLREAGYGGPIVLISDEPHAPYDRPPLSKELLTEGWPEDRLFLRSAGWYEEQDIDLRLGVAVTAIDPAARELRLSSGEILNYEKLLLATGATARALPGIGEVAVPSLLLRTLEDARAIRDALNPDQRIVIIGAGVIGLEVAASAARRGCSVDVVDIADRVLSRVVPPAFSDHMAGLHREHGVRLHLDAGAVTLTDTGVHAASVGDIAADLVVVGIGVSPNTALAEAAGLDCRDGVMVDRFCRTSDPDIYAVGDAARFPDPFGQELIRCENWKHAQNQALVAARNMIGGGEPYEAASSMWSDQYDVKLQTVGTLAGEEVLRGEFGGARFMIAYRDEDGRLAGAIGINMAKDMRFAQVLIEKKILVDATALADPKQDLRKLAG